jgi:signal transduction histidine kinase
MTSRLSLGLKFSIAVTVLIIFTMLGVATLIIDYQKEALKQSTFESNLAMTKNLAHDAVESLLVFDPLRLDELVKTVFEATSCKYAMIADKEGNIVAHTRRHMLGSRLALTDNVTVKDYKFLKESVREYMHENELVKEFSYPVVIGNEVLGVATIAYSLSTMNTVIDDRLKNLKKYIYMITGIMLAAGIAGAFIVSNILTKPLKRLKSKMLDIQAGNLNVEAENPRLVRCWERLNCAKKDCPSYGRLRCWATAGTFCHDKIQGQFAQKIGDCRRCVVYKESCGDEINELVEVFNQMVKDLRYNLQELEKANTEKNRMERLSALGEMAMTVAHEIKNPLNSIKMATSYLKNNFHGVILSEFLGIVEEEVSRINDISSNFLGFSKPEPINLKMCNINTLVESTVDLLRQEATEKNIEIIALLYGNLPFVPCDYSRIKQALLNLLLNALEASKAGDTVEITTWNEGPFISIIIEDTGKGISSEEMENIFKPFFTTKTHGSGLGLAIIDRIVKEHGGDIEVDSEVGKGTKFTIKLKVYEYAKT